ncbi:MAG: hypothetical protein D6758_11885 [Gammaproteobacteria bacterium]|nr:MAG: hypothetical protein D6758_11885 [Gammaproteobacteria bacterium]
MASGNEIEQFKAFTRDVRTWLTQIEQTDFSSPWAALRIDSDTVSALLSQENAAMLDQLSDVLGQIEDYVATHATDVDNAAQNGGTLTIPLTRTEWNGAGYTTVSVGDMAVTFGQQDGKLTASASAAGLNFGASAPTLTIKNLSVLTPVPVPAVQGGTLEQFELSAGEHVVTFSADLENSVGHTARLSDARAALVLTKVVSLPEPGALNPHTIEDAFKTGSFSANAEISDGKGNTFKGSITAEGVRLTVDSVNKANLKSVSLSGSFTGSKGTFEAEATARLNNSELYDWLGVKDYSGTRFVYQRVPASELTGEDLLALSRTYLPDQVNEVFRVASIGNWLGTEGHTFYAETGAVSQASDVPAMTQCLKDHLMDSGYAETWWCGGVDALTFAGIPYPEPAYTNDSVIQEITNLFVRYNTVKVNGVVLEPEVTIYNAHVNSLDNNLYISGELKYPALEETENRFANVSLTLKGRAALPELPEATVTISGNRSRLDGGSIALKVDWDAGSYTTVIDVDDNSAEKPKAKVTFYNANGMKLVASSPDTSEDVVDVTGEAFVRGTKVGDLSTSEGHYVMRYTDGTFETLY